MLPTINYPVFTIDLPLSKLKLRYRPLLVKEEKILLIARESTNSDDILQNVKVVLNNCLIDKVDLDALPLVEVEYLFLNLRSNSIGDNIRIRVTDEYDSNIKHEVEFDIKELTIVQDPKNSKKIPLSGDLGIVMKYPTFNSIHQVGYGEDPSDFYNILMANIESVYDANSVYKFSDASEAEKTTFIDSLSVQHLEKVNVFFSTLPKLRKEIKYTNSKGSESSLVLESFYDFF